MNKVRSKDSHTPGTDTKLELKLNVKDLETLQDAFTMETDGQTNLMSFTREQFVEALSLVLCKGSRDEYSDLFDKIDITREGKVDWEKFASHMLLEFYEKDDRTKSSSLPQWKELKTLPGPHKDVIQKIVHLKNNNRYVTVSKEGNLAFWSSDLKLQNTIKISTDSCRAKDLWATDFIVLGNLNKIAISYTSKEIDFYDMELNCKVRMQNTSRIPLCMDYWFHPENTGEAVMVWGDTEGFINIIHWYAISSSIFERFSAKASDKDENMMTLSLKDISDGQFRSVHYLPHKAHQDWVRKISYLPNLECFVSCATNWNTSMIICWLEKHNPTNSSSSELVGSDYRGIAKTSVFTVHQGINSFAFNESFNLIATAGVNFHVCLWNPYVISKPNGLLRGHMASVTDVQFHKTRNLLFSFSKDKVLRIWDIQLQVCIHRLAGIFPKGQEVYSRMFFHEEKLRLFITFNYGLTMLEMKPDIKDKIYSHQKPLIGCLYNSLYNQIVTACTGGIIYCWMVDTGQRVKTISEICTAGAEMTCITQDSGQTRLYTGATDGLVKIYDFNGHCYHTLQCAGGNPADISQIVILKRCILVFGFSRLITAFWTSNFKEHKVTPSKWKGVTEHKDDILSGAPIPPHAVATGSYDGEIIIWNINSEQASRVLNQRSQDAIKNIREAALQQKSTKVKYEHTDHKMDIMFNVSRLIYLEARKRVRNSTGAILGANLVSCGGNGIVRFWNASDGNLIGEFVAHENASSIIMSADPTNSYLATGDMDGILKLWDISNYCLTEDANMMLMQAPPLKLQWICHTDEISGITFCQRYNRLLLITSSADQSAALWELTGQLVGRLGQEHRWKLSTVIETPNLEPLDSEDQESDEEIPDAYHIDPNWQPDPEATRNPAGYRINTWNQTTLGKDYQELRTSKRERIQPKPIPDLPYLHGEKLGKPTFGPFYSLKLTSMEEVEELEIPEFMDYPDKFFSENPDFLTTTARVPLLNETLRAVFDEQSLFTKDLEARNRLRKALTDRSKSNAADSVDGKITKTVRLQPIKELPKLKNKPLVSQKIKS